MKFGATDCITVLGTRGTGKSSLARNIGKMWPRQIIIDPVSDWTEGEIINSFDQLIIKLKQLKTKNAKTFKLIFRFNPDLENKEELLNHVLRLAFHFKNLQVVIDEIQLFSNPHYLPNYLKNLLFIGRHHGISVLCITQRPGQLNKSILAQSLHVFCGQLHEKNDIRSISDFINIDNSKLINLPRGSFFHFSPNQPIKIIKLF